MRRMMTVFVLAVQLLKAVTLAVDSASLATDRLARLGEIPPDGLSQGTPAFLDDVRQAAPLRIDGSIPACA